MHSNLILALSSAVTAPISLLFSTRSSYIPRKDGTPALLLTPTGARDSNVKLRVVNQSNRAIQTFAIVLRVLGNPGEAILLAPGLNGDGQCAFDGRETRDIGLALHPRQSAWARAAADPTGWVTAIVDIVDDRYTHYPSEPFRLRVGTTGAGGADLDHDVGCITTLFPDGNYTYVLMRNEVQPVIGHTTQSE